MKSVIDYAINELETMLNTPSPTGYDKDINNYLKGVLKDLDIEYTQNNKGTIIAKIDGDNSKEAVMVSAHLDTLGAMVKEVKSNGRLKLDLIGGYMVSSIEGENCVIRTSKEKEYTGTIQTIKPSVHIYADAKDIKRNKDNVEVVIDERVSTKDEVKELGINVGDFVFLDTRTRITDSGFIKSRHLDDKAGVAVILGAIKKLKLENKKPHNTTYILFSNYEEVGHGSSIAMPEEVKEFLAIDMATPGDGQTSTEYEVTICAKDSSGPYDYGLKNKLVEIAEENDIKYNIDIYNYYGSDASAALRAGNNVAAGLIGPGVFASHGYERCHKDSIVESINLLYGYLLKG